GRRLSARVDGVMAGAFESSRIIWSSLRTDSLCCDSSGSLIVGICYALASSLFFFFQAEDGIRDRNVTGVQTCALPISSLSPSVNRWPEMESRAPRCLQARRKPVREGRPHVARTHSQLRPPSRRSRHCPHGRKRHSAPSVGPVVSVYTGPRSAPQPPDRKRHRQPP